MQTRLSLIESQPKKVVVVVVVVLAVVVFVVGVVVAVILLLTETLLLVRIGSIISDIIVAVNPEIWPNQDS